MKTTLKPTLLLLPLVCSSLDSLSKERSTTEKPNIILIYADDIGYGDFSCNGMTRTTTPNVDKLSEEGVNFSNVHTSSATSTPSRFSLLTGKYAWRLKGTGVATGDAAMIIKPDMETLPDMLKRAGYTTGAVGKWHLGLGNEKGKQNWNGTITPSLKDIGFDYSFIMAATGDRVPCVYIEQGAVENLDSNSPIEVSYRTPFEGEPLGKTHPHLLRMHPSHGHDMAIVDSIPRIGFMRGGDKALWHDEEIADRIVEQSIEFIENNQDTTFFLYMATNDIHVPRMPHSRFHGKSGMGYRGDALLSFDWSVGQILNTLDSLNLTDNTLIILTSDNGPVIDDGYEDEAVELLGDHDPRGGLRGGKYSILEAGTRVPFIVKWTNHVPAAKQSNALFSQVDLFSSLASLTGTPLTNMEAPDSQDHLDVLLGKDRENGREWVVIDAGTKAIKIGDWKYIVPNNRPSYYKWTNTESGNSKEEQLYNLKIDILEQNNLAKQHPKKVEELKTKLKKVIATPKTR